MRVSALFALGLATKALAQASSSGPEPTPEPTTTLVFITDSDTQTTITSTPTSTETTSFPIVSTAAPPTGGGATCVQRCLAEAADSVGCRGGADLECVCASGSYLSMARTCFTNSTCDNELSQAAVQDYGAACGATPTPSETLVTTRSTSLTPTPISPTTQTVVLTTSVVVTTPGGATSTVTSGFTTVRTVQNSGLTTGGASAPTTSTGGGSSNGAPGMNIGHLTSMGTMLSLGVIGGIVVLAF
ncbi:unnamed protein product [Rhizoctonia solani]|uniref:CFEM domain-containing protein n=1 Tax=Rhizoctonia solani TaxID=456999 RepID=A0A8H2W905_9AGAM|nr:unnamed protein product [Rhizoctonia solani]